MTEHALQCITECIFPWQSATVHLVGLTHAIHKLGSASARLE